MMSLRRLALRHLGIVILVQLAVLGILLLTVNYDLQARTPWILHPTITKIVGWLAALYGLFWIVWWFFWSAIEGGREQVTVLGVIWSPLTIDFCSEGPFAWSRYPLAFGFLEFLWGLGFLVQSTTIVLRVVPAGAVIAILGLYLIVDRRKLQRHAEAYAAYRKSTPLFFPRIPDSSVLMHLFRRRRH